MTTTYYAPHGGHPDQTQLLTDRAMFRESYAVLPRGTMRDIVTSLLPFWDDTPAVGAGPAAVRLRRDLLPVHRRGGPRRWQRQTRTRPAGRGGRVRGRGSGGVDGRRRRARPGHRRLRLPAGRVDLDPAQSGRRSGARFHWIRKAYESVDGLEAPPAFVTSDAEVEAVAMPGTEGRWKTSRFADPADVRHDMHVNIVTFEPGAVIPFAETHVMEHGLYVLQGKAVYRLNEDWVEVEEGDFMWLRAFCPQACYAGGPGTFRYLLYKDVNRHARLSRQFG